MKRLFSILIAVLLAACACGKAKEGGATGPAAGTERGACYGNGTCNEGLVCLSDLCVRPPPADCAKVAKKLDLLTLGNYTPMEERAAFDQKMTAECQAAHLSKEDGDCILHADSKRQLAQCPRPLALGDCDKMTAYVMKEIAPREQELSQYLAEGPEQLIARCRELAPTRDQEDCVMKSRTMDDLKACNLGR